MADNDTTHRLCCGSQRNWEKAICCACGLCRTRQNERGVSRGERTSALRFLLGLVFLLVETKRPGNGLIGSADRWGDTEIILPLGRGILDMDVVGHPFGIVAQIDGEQFTALAAINAGAPDQGDEAI